MEALTQELAAQFEHAKELALGAAGAFKGANLSVVMTALAILVAGILDQVAKGPGPQEAREMQDLFPAVVAGIQELGAAHDAA